MSTQTNFKWRTILGLILVWIAVWFGWDWVWGLLFLFWVIPDLFSGVTHFMEPIFRQENPILYWLIMASWLVMCIYLIALAFFPELKYYQ